MLRKVIVGYDGRDPALDAVVLGRLIAEATGGALALLIALPYEASQLGRERYEEAVEEDAERLLGRARPLLEGLRFETLVHGGESAPRLLNDIAEQERADLIVLGSTHRGPLGRLHPGSVAERLLAGSPCAVAVAPRGFADREGTGIEALGVGYDGSGEAGAALELAGELARRSGARLQLYAIAEAPGLASPEAAWLAAAALGGGGPELRLASEQALESSVSRALEGLSAEVAATSTIIPGSPAQVLVERSEDVDLLVIGSRGYGPIRRVLLGQVSSKVIRNAACPVIVVPRAA